MLWLVQAHCWHVFHSLAEKLKAWIVLVNSPVKLDATDTINTTILILLIEVRVHDVHPSAATQGNE